MIFVANPGTHPEMMHLAGGLISSGHPVRYFTSSSWPQDAPLQRLARSPYLADLNLGKNLQRRSLPFPLTSKEVVGTSRGYELLVQIAMRKGKANVRSAIDLRNRKFQRFVGQQLGRTTSAALLVAQYTAARSLFEATPKTVTKVLNYPIAHHRWLMERMAAEADTNPRWASLLQGHDFTAAELSSLDEEIEMADAVLVPSTFAAATFVQSGVPAEKIVVVPLGCETREAVVGTSLRPKSLAGNGSDDGLNLLFAGQVTQRKGIGYLVEAVRELPNTRLTIVGSASVEARAKVGKVKNVAWLPSVPRHELYALMQEADLLVLPSLAEGFGLVALEAMANGTPCLLSDQTFGPDLIVDGKNGYLLEDISTPSLVKALTEITGNKDHLASVGTAATATAREYSWARYATEVTRSLEKIHGMTKSV